MNNIREILPKMASLAGNTRATQQLAYKLVEKLDKKDFEDFKYFLKQCENKNTSLRNRNFTKGLKHILH